MVRTLRGKTSRPILQAARRLRRELTPTEQNLWQELRGGQLSGLKFRRQHPIGSYVLDFFCVQTGLAVELDGTVHLETDQVDHDGQRDAFLAEQGIRTLRIKNWEVEQDLAGVLKKILEAAGK